MKLGTSVIIGTFSDSNSNLNYNSKKQTSYLIDLEFI
jgi:hypothetical protein